MKPTTRYTLIALGFIVFLILAPLLVFYVSGRTINFGDGDENFTGILDAKSNPSDAKLLIDGKEHSSTPAIARFLNQGEYQFTLRKDGYYDWTKRLPIETGKVTYTQEGVSEIHLIKKSEPKVLVPKDVTAFALVNDTLWFASGNSVISAPVNKPEKQIVIPLNFRPRSITSLRNQNHLYLSNNSVLDLGDNVVTRLPRATEARSDEIGITPNNVYLYLDGEENLYAYDKKSGKNWLLKNKVLSFTILGNTGYFVERSNNTKITTAFWNGNNFNDFQTIVEGGNGPLYITNDKELFCECDSLLSRVGQTLEPISYRNIATNLDLATNELSFLTGGNELWFYNFLTNKPQLLTRGNLTTQTTFLIRSSIGYGFIGNQSGLEAIEIDERDKQNRYQLLSGKPVWQIALTGNQKTLIALQDSALVSIELIN